MQESSLLDAINGAYERRSREANRFPVRGSSIGSCPRQLAALLNGHEPRSLDGPVLRVFEMGSSRGESLAKVISEAYTTVLLEHEGLVPTSIEGERARQIMEKASDQFGHGDDSMLGKLPLAIDATGQLCIRVHCDVLINGDRGLVKLIEIKTKNQWGFKKLDEEGIGESYEMQVKAQVEGLANIGIDVESASVLFENKDNCELKLMPFNPDDPDVAGRFALQMQRIRTMLLGWLDEAPFDASPAVHTAPFEGKAGKLPWQCNYCNVGPEAGRCVDQLRLRNTKPTQRIPKWEVTA